MTTVEPTATGLRPTFRDAGLDAAFADDGYVVLDVLSPATVADLRARFEAIYVGETENACHRSNESADIGYRRALHELITGALGPVAERLLVDHVTFSSGTLVKWRGPDSVMPIHQDWTMVDERRYRSLSLWLPLCDVDVANGALAVLPGSHRVLNGMRPNPGRPPGLPDPVAGLTPLDLVNVPMKVGSCMVFDHGVLHGSPANTTDAPRAALVLAAAPREAQLMHLWRRPDDVVERYDVADGEFFRHCTPGVPPDHPGIRLAATHEFVPHLPQAVEWVHDAVLAGR